MLDFTLWDEGSEIAWHCTNAVRTEPAELATVEVLLCPFFNLHLVAPELEGLPPLKYQSSHWWKMLRLSHFTSHYHLRA